MKEQSSSKGFAVLSGANVICKVLSLVYLPIQTLLVHNEGNGVIGVGFQLYMFIYALSTAGLPVVISKFVSEQVSVGDFRSAQKILRCSTVLLMVFGVAATSFTFFGAGLLDSICHENGQSVLMFKVIAPTFLFTSLASALRGYFQGRHNMTPTAVSQIIEQIVNSVFTVALEALLFKYAMRLSRGHEEVNSFTAAGSSAATALAALASAMFLLYVYRKTRAQRKHEIRHQSYDGPTIQTSFVYRELLAFSIPALISGISTSAINLIDSTTCIDLLCKAGMSIKAANSLFGIYSTKYQRLLTLATMFIAPLVTAMIPALSSALANDNGKYYRYKIRESYKLIYIVIMPVIAGITFLATPIITLVFPSDTDGGLVVIYGTWIAVLMAVQSIQNGILMTLNHPMISPLNALVGMAAKVACNFILLPMAHINIYGALIGNAVAYIIGIVLNEYFIYRYLRIKLHTSRYLIVPTISSVIMGLSCFGLCKGLNFAFAALMHASAHGARAVVASDIATLLTVPVGAAIYAAIMIKSGAINSKDIRKLPKGEKLCSALKKFRLLEA
jgi:stage V sporulation protein B